MKPIFYSNCIWSQWPWTLTSLRQYQQPSCPSLYLFICINFIQSSSGISYNHTKAFVLNTQQDRGMEGQTPRQTIDSMLQRFWQVLTKVGFFHLALLTLKLTVGTVQQFNKIYDRCSGTGWIYSMIEKIANVVRFWLICAFNNNQW